MGFNSGFKGLKYVPFSVFIYLNACAEGHDKPTSHCRIYIACLLQHPPLACIASDC